MKVPHPHNPRNYFIYIIIYIYIILYMLFYICYFIYFICYIIFIIILSSFTYLFNQLMIQSQPDQARQMLVANPQLATALLHAQIVLGMVTPAVVQVCFSHPLPHPFFFKSASLRFIYFILFYFTFSFNLF